MMQEPVVRAVDVGYGHIKFSDGRNITTGEVRTDSFPSQSPMAPQQQLDAGVMQRRDTFTVPLNGRRYEVAKGIAMATKANYESEVLDADFCLSDNYAARLLGAFNYMAPGLNHRDIDCLVLGLPLNTYSKHEKGLATRFTGKHVINERGDAITVRRVAVYPQPLGGYAAYFAANKTNGKMPTALVIDPGYNTVDWFVCKGMVANEHRSKAVNNGMAAVLRAIAEEVIRATKSDANPSNVVRRIDHALTAGEAFTMYGKHVELADLMASGEPVIEEAAQAVKNEIGSGEDIDLIVMVGGGAKLYAPSVKRKFPRHEVVTLDNPTFANVRGFHLIGEKLAKSAARAVGQAAA